MKTRSSDWSMSVATSQVSPLFQARTNHATSHFCLVEGKPRRECDCRKMLFFIPFIAYAALFEIVNGANENYRSSSQRSCTVDSMCGVLDTILQRQDRLEKTVKEHRKMLGTGRCTEGKGIVKITMFALKIQRIRNHLRSLTTLSVKNVLASVSRELKSRNPN